jgi:hypothetical protein
MCPLCVGTATLLVSGGGSAGGVAALLLKRLTAGKRGAAEFCRLWRPGAARRTRR